MIIQYIRDSWYDWNCCFHPPQGTTCHQSLSSALGQDIHHIVHIDLQRKPFWAFSPKVWLNCATDLPLGDPMTAESQRTRPEKSFKLTWMIMMIMVGVRMMMMIILMIMLLLLLLLVVVVVMDLAVSGNMLAAIGAVEELPVEQLDGDHSKYELLVEEMIELNYFKFQLKLL